MGVQEYNIVICLICIWGSWEGMVKKIKFSIIKLMYTIIKKCKIQSLLLWTISKKNQQMSLLSSEDGHHNDSTD